MSIEVQVTTASIHITRTTTESVFNTREMPRTDDNSTNLRRLRLAGPCSPDIAPKRLQQMLRYNIWRLYDERLDTEPQLILCVLFASRGVIAP